MKRFTETDKWQDPWFSELPMSLKLAWLYIIDSCDCAGIIDLNLKLLNFQVGSKLTCDDILSGLSGRVVKLDCGKLFVPKFISYQQGTDDLNPSNKAHLGIIRRLEGAGIDHENLRGFKGATEGLQSPPSISIGIGISISKILEDFPTLDTDKFKEAWAEKEKHRKERRDKPYTEIGLRKLFAKFSKAGVEASVMAINESISANHQGVFPEKYAKTRSNRDTGTLNDGTIDRANDELF